MIKKIAIKYIEKRLSHYQHQVMSIENVLEYENDIISGSYREKELLKDYDKYLNILQAYKIVLFNLKEEE